VQFGGLGFGEIDGRVLSGQGHGDIEGHEQGDGEEPHGRMKFDVTGESAVR